MDLHHHHHTNPNPNLNPNLNPNPNRSEAERLLGIAEKLLQTRDLTGSREFALLAQETEPLLEGSDQILAITDVLLASETRVVNNRHHDWYSILQTNPQSLSSDPDLLKKNYRRLALLLHPDKNRYPLADSAFKLVADAWALLSDPSRKGLYDHELNVYSKVELRPGPHQHTTTPPGNSEKDKLPVRRSPRGGVGGDGGLNSSDPTPTAPAPHTAPRNNNNNSNKKQQQQRGSGAGANRMLPNFWTACPYCYVLYEYPRAYEECCLRCQNCERAFHATVINSLPPMVPGKEAYYCCWGFFPLGFSLESSGTNKGKKKVDGNNNGNNNVDAGNNNNAANHNNNNNNNNASQNPNSGFPNWMPAGMFGTPVSSAAPPQGGGGANMNMNMNMNASVGGVDISDGSAAAGFGINNNNVSAGFANVVQGLGNSTPSKKRGRPRKNPFPV